MKLIVCVDKSNGMLFNDRRQSRDKEVIDNIVESIGSNTLYIEQYSEQLFSENPIDNLKILDIEQAVGLSDDDYFFLEDPTGLNDKTVSEVTLYKWNRAYPADLYFEVDLGNFKKVSTADFPGSSHDKITKEVWKRVN